jgi:hypothetical protein
MELNGLFSLQWSVTILKRRQKNPPAFPPYMKENSFSLYLLKRKKKKVTQALHLLASTLSLKLQLFVCF